MTSRHQRGLSLLELLVVFVIISLVSTLLIQGFGFGLSLYERVSTNSQSRADTRLMNHWFRVVNSHLVAVTGPEPSLQGDEHEMVALTLNPLLGKPGAPTRVQWQLTDGQLTYKEGGASIVLGSIDSAGFQYLEASGGWVEEWPAGSDTQELPRAVRLAAERESLTAVVKTRLKPDRLLEDSLDDG